MNNIRIILKLIFLGFLLIITLTSMNAQTEASSRLRGFGYSVIDDEAPSIGVPAITFLAETYSKGSMGSADSIRVEIYDINSPTAPELIDSCEPCTLPAVFSGFDIGFKIVKYRVAKADYETFTGGGPVWYAWEQPTNILVKARLRPSNGQSTTDNIFPSDGAWLNYDPTEVSSGGLRVEAISSEDGTYNTIYVRRQIVQTWDGTIINRAFNNVNWSPGVENLPVQDENLAEGLYGWNFDGYDNNEEGVGFVVGGLYPFSWDNPSREVGNGLTDAPIGGWRYFGVDTTAPNVSCSITNPPGGGTTTQTSIDVAVSASDPAPPITGQSSGVALGELQVNEKTGGGWNTISSATGGTVNFTATPGNSYDFRYRARDNTIEASGASVQWSTYSTCGNVVVENPNKPDFIIVRNSIDNVPTSTGIIANNYPPATTFGSRQYVADQSVALRGWVKNIGTDASENAGGYTRVGLNFYPNEGQAATFPANPSNPLTYPSGPSPDPSLWVRNVFGDWPNGLAIPFGTACADVDNDGGVSTADQSKIINKFGFSDPNYDLDDDGIVTVGDIFAVSSQFGMLCTRNISTIPIITPVNFTTASSGGNYQIFGVVDSDPTNEFAEILESNNLVADSYEVINTCNFSINGQDVTMGTSDTAEMNIDITWSGEGAGCDPATSMQLTFSGPDPVPNPANSMKILFYGKAIPNPGDCQNVDVCTFPKGAADQTTIVLELTTLNTDPGFYGNLRITGVATPQGLGLPIIERETTHQITVKDKPWVKTKIGDVGAKGDIDVSTPNQVTLSSTFNAVVTAGDSNRTHRICHNKPQLDNDPIPHDSIGYKTNQPIEVGFLDAFDCIGRTYLSFDTSGIPDGALILDARLSFDYQLEGWINNDFDVRLVSKDWPSLSAPPSTLDLDNNWHLEEGTNTYPGDLLFNTTVLTRSSSTETISDLNVTNTIVDNGFTKFEMKAENEALFADLTNDFFRVENPIQLTVYWRTNAFSAEPISGWIGHQGSLGTAFNEDATPCDGTALDSDSYTGGPIANGGWVGLPNNPGDFLRRTYLAFDTSKIPAGLAVTSASISFTVKVEDVLDDFDTLLVRKNWCGNAAIDNDTTAVMRDEIWHQPPNGDTKTQLLFRGAEIDGQFNTSEIEGFDQGQATYTFTLDKLAGIEREGEGDGITMWELRASEGLIDSTEDVFELEDAVLSVILETSSDYVVIADDTISGFVSLSNWLVRKYDDPNTELIDEGINTGYNLAVDGDLFSALWQSFGKDKAKDWGTDGDIPPIPPDPGGGVYAYPSAAAINNNDPQQAFIYSGAAISYSDPTVLFVNGNLNIDSDLDLGNRKVIFVSRGNTTILASVNNADGFFVADGKFITSLCLSNDISCQLTVNGGAVAFDVGGSGQVFDFGRDLRDLNSIEPAEIFNYDPSYLYLFTQLDATTKKPLFGEDNTNYDQIPP